MYRKRRRGRVRTVGVVLAFSLAAASATSWAAGPWPDGEWYGFISGGGLGSGVISEGGRSIAASGTATADGIFDILIIDGEPKGSYEITWRGTGSGGGGSGTTEINEVGAIEGAGGIPLLVRESATGRTTVEGISVPFTVPRLSPAPTPLQGDYADCQMIEGSFEGKLAALAAAFEANGFKVASEESFSAFRFTDTSAAGKLELTKRVEELRTIAGGFGLILADIDSVGLSGAIQDATALIDRAEILLTELGALPECEGVNIEGFSLGISKALEVFVKALLEVALDQQDAKAIAAISGLAGRGGVLPYVQEAGVKATELAARQASADKDLVALDWLIVAAFTFGDVELLQWIVGEIAAIRGSS